MAKNRNQSRAARKKARAKVHLPVIHNKETHNEVKNTPATKVKKVFAPIAHMVGHTLGSAAAYGAWILAEILVSKVLALVIPLGSAHQAELFEAGETIMFYAGFIIWAATFIIGAVRLVLEEAKIFGKK